MTARIEAVLVDLGGVVYVGDQPLPGSLEALSRLKAAGLKLRYITNTTRRTRDALLDKLSGIGLAAAPDEVFTPARAALDYLRDNDLEAVPLVHPSLAPELEGIHGRRGRALVVGDAGDAFSYRSLNEAFRTLDAGAEFLALAKNRYFRDDDGRLALDAGPFVAALEFATRREALVLGKPSRDFFHSAVASLGSSRAGTIMIGDDVDADVAGAIDAGLQGVLVRTGKYQSGDENDVAPAPHFVAEDLAGAADWILAER